MRYAILILLVSGCGLLGPSVPSVVQQMVEAAAQKTLEEVNKELEDVPIECEFEYDHLKKKLFMLCEADLK
jgi:hypothetical protein